MIRRMLLRTAMALGLTVVMVLLASPAQAATWSLSTTGAKASGSYSLSAQTYYVSARITDTAADGSCAYVVFRPQVYYGYTNTWLSVGATGYEERYDVCGSGAVRSVSSNINVYNRMSSLDRTAGSKIRMYIRVCRDVSWGSDNCSGMTTPPVDF